MKRFVLVFAVLATLAGLTASDTVTTTVTFNVPSSVSFTVTLPGQSGTASGPTAGVEFNSSVVTANKINCSVVAAGANAQTAAIPCFNYSNTGNRDINVTLQFGAGVPSQVKVKAGQNNTAWIAACTCTSLIGGSCEKDDCVYVNSTTAVKVANITYTGYQEVWLWADFTNYMGGSTDSATLTHTSQAT